jgi:type I restriction enzyme S subunit
LAAIRCDSTKCDQRYIHFYLKRFEADIAASGVGSTFTAINRNDIERIELPVPPLAEQKRITKLLDEADELRKLRAQADRRMADLIPGLFNEMFGSPLANPFDWPVESVGTLFNEERGGAKCGPFGSALKKHEYVESGIPVWGIPNVLPNQFIEEGSLFISQPKFEKLRAYSIESGDLLISRAGTVGRICVARPKAKASIIGTNLIRLSLDHQKIVPEFFSALMTHFTLTLAD